jgi:hypothetical protein
MAEQQGGYRKPATPAMVSGPGAFSQRTDGQPGTTEKQAARYIGGGEWGTNKSFNEDVVGEVPMAATAGVPTQGSPAMPAMPDMSSVPKLFAPDANPDVPVTAGSPVGPGPGPEVMQYQRELANQQDSDLQALKTILPVLRTIADKDGSSYATRLLLKKINATIGTTNI